MENKYLVSLMVSIIVLGFLLVYRILPNVMYSGAIAVLIVIYLIGLHLVSKRIKIGEKIYTNLSILHMTAFIILLSFLSFDMIILSIVVVVLSAAFFVAKTFFLRDVVKVLFMLMIVLISAATLFQPAVMISKGQGTVLSDNWWNALNWIKNNTAECTTVATYWDPGHFITGIAKRTVVFDGASQNNLWNITVDNNLTYEQMEKIAATDKFTFRNITADGQDKVLIETARIQDIAATLATDNESAAIEILKKYRKPNCSEMYYLATSDLIGKSYWWTYFWKWNPIDKGCATPISQLGLKQAKPSLNGGITYVYEGGIPNGCNSQIGGQVVVNQQNNSMNAYVLRDNALEPVEQFVFYTEQGGFIRSQPGATIKGMVILDPSRQSVIFVPSEIKDSMFVKMFFFNGQGLKIFEYVDQWGGEVKLFRIRFE